LESGLRGGASGLARGAPSALLSANMVKVAVRSSSTRTRRRRSIWATFHPPNRHRRAHAWCQRPAPYGQWRETHHCPSQRRTEPRWEAVVAAAVAARRFGRQGAARTADVRGSPTGARAPHWPVGSAAQILAPQGPPAACPQRARMPKRRAAWRLIRAEENSRRSPLPDGAQTEGNPQQWILDCELRCCTGQLDCERIDEDIGRPAFAPIEKRLQ
jgi:hypothetical protein